MLSTIAYIPSKTTHDTLWVKVSHTCIFMSIPSFLSIDWLKLVTGYMSLTCIPLNLE